MNKLYILGLFLTALTAQAYGQSNAASSEITGNSNIDFTSQTGSNNTSSIEVAGNSNDVNVLQNGSTNDNTVGITGDFNESDVVQQGDNNTTSATVNGAGNYSYQQQGLGAGTSSDDVSIVSQTGNNHVAATLQGNNTATSGNRSTVTQEGGNGNSAGTVQGEISSAQLAMIGIASLPFSPPLQASFNGDATILQNGDENLAAIGQSKMSNLAYISQTGATNLAITYQAESSNNASTTQSGTSNRDIIFQGSGSNTAVTSTTGANNRSNITQTIGMGNDGFQNITGASNDITTLQSGALNQSFVKVGAPMGQQPAGAVFIGESARNDVFVSQSSSGNRASSYIEGTDNTVQLFQSGMNNTSGSGSAADGIQLSGIDNNIYAHQHGDANLLDINVALDENIVTVNQYGNGDSSTVNIIGNGNSSTILQQ